MNEQKYDSDIRETIENLLKQNDVQDALCFVKDTLPETIEIQKEWLREARPKLDLYLNNRMENEKLTEMRDYLLPRLLNGQISVRG